MPTRRFATLGQGHQIYGGRPVPRAPGEPPNELETKWSTRQGIVTSWVPIEIGHEGRLLTMTRLPGPERLHFQYRA